MKTRGLGHIVETGTSTLSTRDGALVTETSSSVVSHDATGALAAESSSIAGSAARSGAVGSHDASGALSAGAASIAGTAAHLTLHTSSGALSAGAATIAGTAAHSTPGLGTLTTDPLKNNTATPWASETGITAYAYSVADGTLAASWTGETTDASGVLTVSDAALTPAADYWLIIQLSGGAEGFCRLTAV